MTQYSPYQPPSIYPPAGGSSAGRRAGILLFVLGALALIGGCCGAVGGGILPRLISEHPELAVNLPHDFSIDEIQRRIMIHSILILGTGFLLIVLGFLVRRGNRGVLIPALLLTALLTLYLVLNLLGTLLVGFEQGPAAALLGGCFVLIPLVLFILLFVWLLEAYRNPTPVLDYQQQYAQAYQHYLWQQQQYQQQQVQPPPPGDGDSHDRTDPA